MLVCGGAALWLEVSFLVSAIVLGATIANLARHHEYPFHEIENIEWPVMVIFFMLAGASLQLDMLDTIGLVAVIFLLARTLGKVSGAWLGARLANAARPVRCWMGVALLPQAGVAIGLALLAAQRFPDYRELILPLVVGTTIIFELGGPVLTRIALNRTASCTGIQEPRRSSQ